MCGCGAGGAGRFFGMVGLSWRSRALKSRRVSVRQCTKARRQFSTNYDVLRDRRAFNALGGPDALSALSPRLPFLRTIPQQRLTPRTHADVRWPRYPVVIAAFAPEGRDADRFGGSHRRSHLTYT